MHFPFMKEFQKHSERRAIFKLCSKYGWAGRSYFTAFYQYTGAHDGLQKKRLSGSIVNRLMFKANLVDRGLNGNIIFSNNSPVSGRLQNLPTKTLVNFGNALQLPTFFPYLFLHHPQHQFPPFILFPYLSPPTFLYIYICLCDAKYLLTCFSFLTWGGMFSS